MNPEALPNAAREREIPHTPRVIPPRFMGWTSIHWLHKLKQPTLIMAGADDPLVPLVNARILSMLIPDNRVYVVPGAAISASLLHSSTKEVPVMNIVEKLHTARDQLGSRAQSYRANAAEGARQSALRVADRVSAARRPIRALAAAGQQLSNLSNRYVKQLIGQQAHALEGILEGGVERLKRAAKADSLRGFVSGQATLWSSSRERLGSDLQATWKITRDAGRELRDLTAQTHTTLRHGSKTAARATTKGKKSRRSRKPAA